ncbi:RICIN domain-containing protein [Kitasatospora gansuensis]
MAASVWTRTWAPSAATAPGCSSGAATVGATRPGSGRRPGQPVGYYKIQTEKNYRCLDADLGTINGNGTKVQLWDCNGWDNQIWIWNGTTLQTLKNNRVLDADANTIPRDGTRVQLWDRNGWDNQRWIFN